MEALPYIWGPLILLHSGFQFSLAKIKLLKDGDYLLLICFYTYPNTDTGFVGTETYPTLVAFFNLI